MRENAHTHFPSFCLFVQNYEVICYLTRRIRLRTSGLGYSLSPILCFPPPTISVTFILCALSHHTNNRRATETELLMAHLGVESCEGLLTILLKKD